MGVVELVKILRKGHSIATVPSVEVSVIKKEEECFPPGIRLG